MHKKSLEIKIVAFLLSVTLVACDKKEKKEVESGLVDNGSQVVSTTTTTTTNTTTTLPTVTTTTLPTVTTTTSTTTTTTLPPSAGFDLFKEVAYNVGERVDKVYSSYRDLLVQRGSGSVHKTDSCDANLNNRSTFADRIAYYVNMNMTSRKAQISLIADLFGVTTDMNKLVATSLISNSMCEVTKDTLKQTIGENRIPSASVIAQMNQFAKKYNTLRSQMNSGSSKTAALEMNQLWSRMNMCLSYVESLTTADTNSSDKVAQKYAPSDYRRPAGVLFYEDPLQNNASRLNLGLFQFTPDAGGEYSYLYQAVELDLSKMHCAKWGFASRNDPPARKQLSIL